ncbi:MAG: hypothetical protein ACPGLY_10530 [Rubripirellula sp.]
MDKQANNLVGLFRRILGIAVGVPVGIAAGIIAVAVLDSLLPTSVGKGVGQMGIFLGAFLTGTTFGVVCTRLLSPKTSVTEAEELP